MKKILLLEDDKEIGSALSQYLKKHNYTVDHCELPSLAKKALNEQSFDLVILDIMLPEMSGTDFCKEVRKESDIPIIMLTAKTDIMDKIIGLELGADDYMGKPFEPRELLARIEAVLRRSSGKIEEKDLWTYENVEVCFSKRSLFISEKNVDLTTYEFEILMALIKSQGRVLSRDDIMNTLLGIDADVFSRSVDVAISRLRQKLKDDSKKPFFIKTIWGKGYQFLPRGEFR